MPTKTTEERVKSIAKKMNAYSTDLTPEERLATVMEKIEDLAEGESHKWRSAMQSL